MDTEAYYRSLAAEIEALKNRVRNFIAKSHWQTDGEWKESVLRAIIQRHLPSDVGVGRGFVIKPSASSSQIDVLLYDTSKPLLYRDGDLVFVTVDAVRGIVEVKSRLSSLPPVLSKLAKNAEFIQEGKDKLSHDLLNPSPSKELFVGLFCYDWEFAEERVNSILQALQKSARGKDVRVINHLSLGSSLFIHYQKFRPELQMVPGAHRRWHSYYMENLAQGYFIFNAVASVARVSVSQNKAILFPPSGKKSREIGDMALLAA